MSASALLARLEETLRSFPEVEGQGPFLSNASNKILSQAQKISAGMKDEFVSQEHLLLALMADEKNLLGQECRRNGIGPEQIQTVLKQMRGSQKVTDANAEDKYQALEKYARDLTVFARQGKLDPVIGRDDEIRRRDPGFVPAHQE